MTLKVCIFTFYNQYESKRYFACRLAESLRKLNAEVLVLDPLNGVFSPQNREEIFDFAPDFTLSFNSFLPDQKGKFLWDYLEIPHFSILVDPAFYAIEMKDSPFSLFTSVDREDCKWFSKKGMNIEFWPHAVESNPPILKEAERIYDVVFLGTCTDFGNLKALWRKTLRPNEIDVLECAIEKMLKPPLKSLIEVLMETYKMLAIRDAPFDFKQVFYYLDHFVRGKDRFELIRAIQGVDVHIFGEPAWTNPDQNISWQELLKGQSNIIFHPPVSYQDSFKVLSQAKISLNSSPFFKHGSHERILNAFMAGALPLTTRGGFVEEFFSPGQDLMTYQIGKWNEITEEILQLSTSDSLRLERVKLGKTKVLAKHTWDMRAKELLHFWQR